MTRTISIDEASRSFPQLLEQVIASNDEIIISREGTPVARLLPMPAPPAQRVPGTARGEIVILPEFDASLPEEVIDSFYMGKIEP